MSREQWEVSLGCGLEIPEELGAYEMSAAYVAEAIEQAETSASHHAVDIVRSDHVAVRGVESLDCVPLDIVTTTRKGGRHWRLVSVRSAIHGRTGSELVAVYEFRF